MRYFQVVYFALVAIALGACQAGSSQVAAPSRPDRGAASDDQVQKTGSTASPGAAPVVSRARGVPHSSEIDLIVLGADGQGALTRGRLGEVRLWTALDGSVEPLAVPAPGARHLALAHAKSQWRIGFVDPAGTAHVWQYAAGKGFSELFATAPKRQHVQIEFLPGAEHAVVLRRDFSVALLDASGKEVVEMQARGFRPIAVYPTTEANRLVAVVGQGRQRALQRIHIERDRTVMALAGTRATIERPLVRGSDVVVSPDGALAAYLSPGNKKQSDVYVLGLDAPASKDDKPVATSLSLAPRFGFATNRTLVIHDGLDGSTSVVPVGQGAQQGGGRVLPAGTPAAGADSDGALPQAFASDLHVMGFGRWLRVGDLSTGKARYLGYPGFAPMHVAISPGGTRLLWVSGQSAAHIESVPQPTGPAIAVSAPAVSRRAPLLHGLFIDDSHAVLADGAGNLHLVEIAAGQAEILSSVAAGGAIAELEYQPASKLLRVAHDNNVWLYAVAVSGKPGFTGPYVVSAGPGTWSGLATTAAGQTLWTLDQDNVYRTYDAAELRASMSRADMLGRGDALPLPRNSTPVAGDGRGQRFHIEGRNLVVYSGNKEAHRVALGRAQVAVVAPSPDGSMVAMVERAGAVSVFRLDTGERLWASTAQLQARHVAWTPDGKALAVASARGGLLVEAATGAKRRTTCGPRFEIRDTQPLLPAERAQTLELCEP